MESEYEHPIANSSSASSTTTTSSGGGSNNSSNSNLLMNLPMMPSLFDDHHERRLGNSGGGGGGGDEGDDEHEEEEEEEDEDDDEGVQLLRRHSLPEAPPMLMALEAVAAARPSPPDEQPPAMFVAPAPLSDNNNSGGGGPASSSASTLATTYAAVATQTTPPLIPPPSLPSISSSSSSTPSTSSSSSTPLSHQQTLPHPPSPLSQQQQEQQQLEQFDPLQQHSPAPPFEQRNPSPPPPLPQPSQLAQQQQQQIQLQQQQLQSSSQPPLPPHSPPQHEQESHHQHSPSPSSIQQQTPPPPPLPPQPQEQSLHHPSPSPSQYDHHHQVAAAGNDDDLGLDEDGRSSSILNPPAIGQAVFATPPPPIGHQHQHQSLVGDASLIVGAQPSSSHPLTSSLPPPQGHDDDDPAKESHYASHYSHYTHPSPEFAISHSHHNHNPCFGSGLESGCGSAGAGYDSTMYGNQMGEGPYGGGSKAAGHGHSQVDRIKQLYPNVDESETPLPRCWSPHDKCLTIGLSNNNLKVQYKGVGKQHNDAASVRTAHPIPPSCGLYYFEVKIICKGKNGYMGIGLTAQQFRMNHLPGWDKHSYGYHGDDGKSFSSSGTGQAYGPTFTTGDIIGCCVNFVTNTCFYTKNGIDLGVAFRDLPINTKLYPTVGLQTAGEEVDANFGQEPFKFDQFEDMLQQMRMETKAAIYNFPVPDDLGDPTIMLHKMVSSYLVHNGYSETADAFARATSQMLPEEMQSVRNRQKILKLIMSGRMGQAIEHTSRSYPGLLENNHSLMFMLKCRQFIEMINGSDLETSVIQSTKGYQNGKASSTTSAATAAETTTTNADVQTQTHTTTTTATVITSDDQEHQQDLKKSKTIKDNEYDELPKNDGYMHDVEMENNGNGFGLNGNSCKNGNGNFSKSLDIDEEMDIDVSPSSSSKHVADIQRILQFGRELSQISQQLEKENNLNDEDKQMLHDAFSLIAYSNPWSSPLGWQLCPTKRENICAALNSAILESLNFPRRPPLDYCVAHAAELLKKMSQTSLGLCAFINVNDVFPPN